MRLLAISYSFPHESRPYSGVFVQSTLDAIASLGHEVAVVAPQRKFRERHMPVDSIVGGVRVLRPAFISAGAYSIGRASSYWLTQRLFNASVLNIVKKARLGADVVYSHFMLPSGLAALEVARVLRRPAVCTLGESVLEAHESKMSHLRLAEAYAEFDRLVFNSPHTRSIAIDRYGVPSSKCTVVPNGVDPARFFPRDKLECRRQLGLPEDEPIVIFVGSFIHRKGPLRVLQACRKLNPRPRLIFIGAGPEQPSGNDVLFARPVEHEQVPLYLCASDVFVLPTLGEGMSNAVIEASACGLQIVTSPIAPNIAILGATHPFLADPLDIDQLAGKIDLALKRPADAGRCPFSTEDRARALVDLMERAR